MAFLTGWKTYITSAAAILTAVAAYLNGGETLDQAVQLVFTALLAAFIRSGVANSK